MKSPIKYRGGKTREIDYFINYFPNEFDRYFEPFLGGGAVYFAIEPSIAILNDINPKLMLFYKELKNDYIQMRKQLDELHHLYEENQRAYKNLKHIDPELRVENRNEKLYYRLRDEFNHPELSSYLRGVLYYFINKTAYSGMIRYNKNGDYNVPYGRYENFNTNLLTEEHSNLLQNTELHSVDYCKMFSKATEKDFMFLDPPYDCVFNDYGNLEMGDGFNEIHHRRLANDFKNLSCKALMVIGKTPMTFELYSAHIKDEYGKSYAVNIRNRFKSTADHIIVTNYNVYK